MEIVRDKDSKLIKTAVFSLNLQLRIMSGNLSVSKNKPSMHPVDKSHVHCHFWSKGTCKKGSNCKFSHSAPQPAPWVKVERSKRKNPNKINSTHISEKPTSTTPPYPSLIKLHSNLHDPKSLKIKSSQKQMTSHSSVVKLNSTTLNPHYADKTLYKENQNLLKKEESQNQNILKKEESQNQNVETEKFMESVKYDGLLLKNANEFFKKDKKK